MYELKAKLEAEAGIEMPMMYPQEGGTTAVILVIGLDPGRRSRLHLAHCGDSRAILARRSTSRGGGSGADAKEGVDLAVESVVLTVDHNVATNQAEARRAEESGGALFGNHLSVDGTETGIQLTRSLGDASFHRNGVVLAEPDLVAMDLGDDELFVVLGTDGLWDHYTNEEVVSFVLNALLERGFLVAGANGEDGPGIEESGAAAEAAEGGATEAAAADEAVLEVCRLLEEDVLVRAKNKGQRPDDCALVIMTFEALRFRSPPRKLSTGL